MWNSSSSNLPPHPRMSKSAPCSPVKPLVAAGKRPPSRADSFHVIHKVPLGDSPYVRAKHVQLVDKEPDKAIALFWAAINAGDRVDSALKDMAIVMKQQNRPEEAIEAIKSLRGRCSDQAQESLDNVLLDLYKRCGRLDDQIALLKHKLQLIYAGLAFNGKRTKTARSQGKKFQVSIEQEATRLLGNLGWAYMQQSDFIAAEAVYRKALSMEPDNNKMCNLGICLMKQGRVDEAKVLLKSVMPASSDARWGADSHLKSYERAQEMLAEMEQGQQHQPQHLPSTGILRLVAHAPQAQSKLKQEIEIHQHRLQQQQQQTQPRSQQMPTYDSWDYDEEEEEEYNLVDDADENANVNIIAQQQEDHHFLAAEALKKKLELLCVNANSNSNSGAMATNTSSNSLKFSPSKPPRPSATARRSLSLESFDNLGAPPGNASLRPPPGISKSAASSPVKQQLFSGGASDDRRQHQPFQVLLPSASCLGGELGFIQSPKGLGLNDPRPPPSSSSTSSSFQQQLQQLQEQSRRLRVFQDITATTSPLAR
ncbi:protein POLLENLESS 3-LIKE 1 isoform X2 [Selaginella moellendorffii]|uniref:protein POLLENLESS 3-LIKE 1 isoform X2 n=1 Tax=Selaginella moellendorffii TaxID=88036 RepID=UPI000D1CDDDC|nr:protein POLLENLESS 3-LIKE 1 isoform X2 [Selaginella moellendorffii]|eukprot:XP_024520174.1 protein POLLENLESS 3-LIKE 1 isoform X2 [Selaginella moellendorffii]